MQNQAVTVETVHVREARGAPLSESQVISKNITAHGAIAHHNGDFPATGRLTGIPDAVPAIARLRNAI